MPGQTTGDMEYGLPIYAGAYIGDMEYESIPVVGGTGAGAKLRNLSVKVSGVWTVVAKAFARVGGVWQETDVKAKIGGIWTLVHEK